MLLLSTKKEGFATAYCALYPDMLHRLRINSKFMFDGEHSIAEFVIYLHFPDPSDQG